MASLPLMSHAGMTLRWQHSGGVRGGGTQGAPVVARAVEPLVVYAGEPCQLDQRRDPADDQLGVVGVQPDLFPFASVSRPGLSQMPLGTDTGPDRGRDPPVAAAGASSATPCRPPRSSRARDRRAAPRPVPPRGLARRTLRRPDPQAVRRARGPRRRPRRSRECRGTRAWDANADPFTNAVRTSEVRWRSGSAMRRTHRIGR